MLEISPSGLVSNVVFLTRALKFSSACYLRVCFSSLVMLLLLLIVVSRIFLIHLKC